MSIVVLSLSTGTARASGCDIVSLAQVTAAFPEFQWTARAGGSGAFSPPAGEDVVAEDEVAVSALLREAVAGTAKPGAGSQAARCSQFDESLIRKLVPGKQVTIEQYGENSCLAKSEQGATVWFERTTDVDATTAAQMAESSAEECAAERCISDAIPALGEFGRLFHHYSAGARRAEVEFVQAGTYWRFVLAPKGELTAQQRADLTELARRAYAK